jgi:2-polyprenyl-6-hydroxyphenyl methylase/3-demethylubiquinone-9 3-methyltransferase
MSRGSVVPGIDEQKGDVAGRTVAFRLPQCTVYRGRAGLLFTDHVDPEPDPAAEPDPGRLGGSYRRYLERELSSNAERVERQLALLEQELGGLDGRRVLDVGPGTGELMLQLARRGAEVEGLEPHDRHLLFLRERGLRVRCATAEQHALDPVHAGRYDVITLWDVIEHVNRPDATLGACHALLRRGGVLLLDTPCREGTFHRIGELLYRASAGRLTGVLQLMYGRHDYGHKQILGRAELREALSRAGLSVSRLEMMHELALPHRSYLQRLLRSQRLAAALAGPTRRLLDTLPLQNKMLVVAHRP